MNDRHETRIDSGDPLVKRRGGLKNDLEKELVERLGLKRHMSHNCLVENDPNGIEVHSMVHRFPALRLLRGHVIGRSHHGARARHGEFPTEGVELRNPEIYDLYEVLFPAAIRKQEDIIWLQIAMNDARRMGRFEPLQHINHHLSDVARSHPPALDAITQSFPFEELHHHVALAAW